MRLILAMNDVDKVLFGSLLDYHRTVRFRGIKQLEEDGRRSAMVGYDDWAPNSVQMHVWLESPAAMNRTFIKECMWYPFVTCGMGIVIGVTPCNNVASLEFNKRLGFRRILTVKDGYALGTDLAIQEMRREECRWLKMRIPDGRKVKRTSST